MIPNAEDEVQRIPWEERPVAKATGKTATCAESLLSISKAEGGGSRVFLCHVKPAPYYVEIPGSCPRLKLIITCHRRHLVIEHLSSV